jgi:hypothetical protein
MFLTILVFPTAFLQANVLVAMKYERLDMWFNVVLMSINVIFCIVGAYFFKSLNVIIISIFLGFVVFHILQDVFLIKKSISSVRHVFEFYALSVFSIGSYFLLNKWVNSTLLFFAFWLVIFCLSIYINKSKGLFKFNVFLNRNNSKIESFK